MSEEDMKKTEAAAAAEDAPVAAKEAPKKKKNWLTVLKWTGIVLLAVGALVLVGAGVTVLVVRLVKKSRNKRKAT